MDDYQPILMPGDPAAQQQDNLAWHYHCSVTNQLEDRSESILKDALDLSKEEK